MADVLSVPVRVGSATPARPGASSWARVARYLGGSIVVGVPWTIVVVAGLGAAVFAFPVGILLAGATLLLARLGAVIERERLCVLFGEAFDAAERPLPGGGFGRRARAAASDPAVWRDAAYLALAGPVAIASVGVGLAWTMLAVGGPTALLWLPGNELALGPLRLGNPLGALVLTLAGFAALAAMPRLPEAVVVPGRWTARSLLAPDVRRLRAEVDQLAAHSDLVASIAVEERRRLERDLHDGAQQRLVSTGLALGLLGEKLAAAPVSPEVRALVAEAHEHVRASMAELRAVVQGYAPRELVDAGLPGALEALAGRTALPVHLSVTLEARPDAAVERTACFVATEATTNALRHAGATSISIDVSDDHDAIAIEIVDDGAGGASVVAGGGLEGLTQRVRSVGGTLTVDGAAGGGTRVAARLPRRSGR